MVSPEPVRQDIARRTGRAAPGLAREAEVVGLITQGFTNHGLRNRFLSINS
ncbi:hypothetical protein QJS66_05240 [Kocuria rhizophila]|nr:hypothetical protein QJS66_05240 [Kocuria rhizophila]